MVRFNSCSNHVQNMKHWYVLIYPSRVLVNNTIKEITIGEIFTKPYVYPTTRKINYPVYLRLGHNCTHQKFWEVLRHEGFRKTSVNSGDYVLSVYKPLTKTLDLHVKLTKDRKVLAEVEPHRYSLQHLLAFVFPVILPSLYEVKAVLDKYGVDYSIEFNGERCRILDNYIFDL